LGRTIALEPALASGAGGVLTSRNPARPDRIIATVSAGSPEVVDRAVTIAQASGRAWAASPADERIALMRKAAELLRRRRFDVAALEVHEVGKAWREADADVTEAI